jgi:HrpA-like RNA helicase
MPLTSIILEIKVFGLGDPRVFDFIERPAESSISSAISKLSVLGCIDQYEEITDLGKILAKMPVDQVLGKMLILGSISQLISPIVAIAAVLSIQSPYTRDSNSRLAEKRRELFSDHGDPFTLMNTFLQWLEEKSNSTVFPN